MYQVNIKGSKTTPAVTLDHVTGRLEISGRSIPQDAVKFYASICSWLEAYKEIVKDKITFHIKLEYFDTSSSKCLFDIFKILKEIQDNGIVILICWYFVYDDYEMKERGEEYESIAELPFSLVEYHREVSN